MALPELTLNIAFNEQESAKLDTAVVRAGEAAVSKTTGEGRSNGRIPYSCTTTSAAIWSKERMLRLIDSEFLVNARKEMVTKVVKQKLSRYGEVRK
jgi:hypothetical protein